MSWNFTKIIDFFFFATPHVLWFLVPWPGIELRNKTWAQKWKHQVLTAGPPGNHPSLFFNDLINIVHFLFQISEQVKVAQSCLTLCNPMDCSLLGSSVHGILQARILEWGAILFSRESSQSRDQTQNRRMIIKSIVLYTGKTIALTRRTFIGKVMSLLFNMLSRLVISFLPTSKHLLTSWLQSPSAVILEPKK